MKAPLGSLYRNQPQPASISVYGEANRQLACQPDGDREIGLFESDQTGRQTEEEYFHIESSDFSLRLGGYLSERAKGSRPPAGDGRTHGTLPREKYADLASLRRRIVRRVQCGILIEDDRSIAVNQK